MMCANDVLTTVKPSGPVTARPTDDADIIK